MNAPPLCKAVRELAALSEAEVKRIVREQFFALLLDREHAICMLPAMVPAEDQRKTLLTELRTILDAAGSPMPEAARRLAHVVDCWSSVRPGCSLWPRHSLRRRPSRSASVPPLLAECSPNASALILQQRGA